MGRFFAVVAQVTVAFLLVEVIIGAIDLTVDYFVDDAPEAAMQAAGGVVVAGKPSKTKRKKAGKATMKPRKTSTK